MGGGGVMRAAAKVAGIGSVNGGLRGVPLAPAGEHSLSAAARGASRPVSAVLSSSSAQTEPPASSVQRSMWEVDDWEFAGGIEEESVSEADYPLPRLVFGGAPSPEEAKSVTADLKDALEKYVAPFTTSHETAVPLPSESSDSKACITITSDKPVAPVPNHAVQAFKLLKENSETQVVASIASDQNVWNAMMQNEALTELLHSLKSNGPPYEKDLSAVESVAGNEDISAVKQKGKEAGVVFSDFVDNVKDSFLEMVNKASDFLRNSVGVLVGEKKKPADPKLSVMESFMQSPIGASLMALAVTVMLMVVLKRG